MYQEKDKYHLLIKNLPDGFAYHKIVTDSNGNPVDYIFLDVNNAFEEIMNLSRDKIIGKKVTEVYPDIKESSFDCIGTYGKVALTGETIHFEQYFEMADRWYDVIAYSDQLGYFAVVFHDIIDRKAAEEALRTSEARYRLLVENANEAILVVQDGMLKFVNRMTAELSGYSEQELTSRPFLEFIPPG